VTPLLDPKRARRWPWLILAVLFIVPAGTAYFVHYFQGLRGPDLVDFATQWVAAPLAVGLLLLFAYLNPARQRG
jgi:hypothetical protein